MDAAKHESEKPFSVMPSFVAVFSETIHVYIAPATTGKVLREGQCYQRQNSSSTDEYKAKKQTYPAGDEDNQVHNTKRVSHVPAEAPKKTETSCR